MNKVNRNLFILLLLAICFLGIYFGCFHDKKTKTGWFTATVFDVNEFVIPKATVKISENIIKKTDSNGRFRVKLHEGTYKINVFINDTECHSGDFVYKDRRAKTVDIHTTCSLWSEITPQYAIVDDYEGESTSNIDWYYTRIGTDRGEMGEGSTQVDIGGGNTSVSVSSGWAGVWSRLMHNAALKDNLDPKRILGPYIKSQYQPSISGVELDLIGGVGTFRIELKGENDNLLGSREFTLTGGQKNLLFSVAPETDIAEINWLIDGSGNATVEEVRLLLDSPKYITPEAVFLFSYGHLSQCYDSSTGWVRDRARWPAADYSSVQTIGTFALATAIAQDLGYVDLETAKEIITKTKDTILSLPTYNGLLPHFITNGEITSGTEWSSVDTANHSYC